MVFNSLICFYFSVGGWFPITESGLELSVGENDLELPISQTQSLQLLTVSPLLCTDKPDPLKDELSLQYYLGHNFG